MSKILSENISEMSHLPSTEQPSEVPLEVLTSPALLFLYYRIEQILGIKPGYEALKTLNNFIEENCGCTFIENPAAYEYLLTSREEIYNLSKYLTVSETYFFRESVHFLILEKMLPEFSKSRHPIRICSAACSIGCEPYSIAMLLEYHNENGLELDYTIDAFDVNNEALETAKNARYTPNTLREHKTSWKHILDLYLIPSGGEYIVSNNIRRKVRFFPLNIMRGLENHYDIIFFRNALIYFTPKNRYDVINKLSSSLYTNGFLFLGISETSSVDHPLLANCNSSEAFYFQKTGNDKNFRQISSLQKSNYDSGQKDIIQKNEKRTSKTTATESINKSIPNDNKLQIPVNCLEINKILEIEEGKSNAKSVLESVVKKNTDIPAGSNLAASVIYFLNAHDLSSALLVLSCLEEQNSSCVTRFLRGEYLFYNGNIEDAEKYYHEAAVKDRFFWPAFYRIAVIASEGNQARYEYKIRKTIESIQLSQSSENNYECFLGGFSRDYFLRILEKKLI